MGFPRFSVSGVHGSDEPSRMKSSPSGREAQRQQAIIIRGRTNPMPRPNARYDRFAPKRIKATSINSGCPLRSLVERCRPTGRLLKRPYAVVRRRASKSDEDCKCGLYVRLFRSCCDAIRVRRISAGGRHVACAQQTSAVAARANNTSLVLPEAISQDFLYADGGSTYAGDVLMYTFPRGKLVGMLSGLTEPAGMCTDRNGNVWITNVVSGGTVTEYAHGGTQPIATLDTEKTLTPQNCSIDPASGNLAEVGYGPEKPHVRGRILGYAAASGSPKTYKFRSADFVLRL